MQIHCIIRFSFHIITSLSFLFLHVIALLYPASFIFVSIENNGFPLYEGRAPPIVRCNPIHIQLSDASPILVN